MKQIMPILLITAMLFPMAGCDKKEGKQESPDLPYSLSNRTNEELIPSGGVVEHGNVVEVDKNEMIPSEDELGEYEEVFLSGDYLDDGGQGGWVLAISLKDITINTYNKITTYNLNESSKSAANFIVPGDAVMFYFTEEDDGSKTIYDIGRVRVEDGARTQEEMAQMYAEAGIDAPDQAQSESDK